MNELTQEYGLYVIGVIYALVEVIKMLIKLIPRNSKKKNGNDYIKKSDFESLYLAAHKKANPQPLTEKDYLQHTQIIVNSFNEKTDKLIETLKEVKDEFREFKKGFYEYKDVNNENLREIKFLIKGKE
ncbi:MAG: hypothetical protein ACXADY_26690 [Candidatus Hodarchaeales archaeon]|jgi:hypothetical protein